jgi:hypothetical protein
MSDGALKVEVTGPLAEEVRAAAAARGVSPEDYVRQQLAFDVALGAGSDFDDDDIADDEAAIAGYERTGRGVPWEEIRAWMQSWGTASELPRPTPRKLR